MSKDYILVYFHTQTVSDNLPDSSFFKQLYGMVDSRYKDNLRALYIIHPSWWLKVCMGSRSVCGGGLARVIVEVSRVFQTLLCTIA